MKVTEAVVVVVVVPMVMVGGDGAVAPCTMTMTQSRTDVWLMRLMVEQWLADVGNIISISLGRGGWDGG